ncbi:MAG: hypothetical protein HOW73_13525 [Polyangiaceae bacterium]|nr:hypothetical protein [Polyangiaceae bacterium]
MKIRPAIVALVIGSVAVVPTALAEESLDGKAVGEATVKDGKATIVIKGASDGIYVNKDYPIKCSVKSKGNGKLDKHALKKEDAKYEDVAGKAGKARSVTLGVGATGAIEGSCKVVVCTDNACSSPFAVDFASK